MRHSVEILKQKLSVGIGASFSEVLSEADIDRAIAASGLKSRQRLFTPIVTVWMWLLQVLSADQSLRNSVKQLGC